MKPTKGYSFIVVGDVFLKSRSDASRPFSPEVEDLLRDAPVALMNLETALTDAGQAEQKAVNLRVAPSAAEYLQELGVDIVNLANNHTMDYGLEGFSTTCATLDNAGIQYVGVLEHGVQKPRILRVDGREFGVLGYTIGGCSRCDFGTALLDEQAIREDTANLKSRNVDRVIVNLHWGEEYVVYPAPKQQRLARSLIEAGADVIIGHHPHVVQGVEAYKEGLIFYSLGNFNFMGSSSAAQLLSSARWGLIALLDFSTSSIKYKCIPVQIDSEFRPCLASQGESEAFMTYLRAISEPLKPNIGRLFWLREASSPHFRNHLPSFVRRIKRYGIRHFLQMIRWLASPGNYGFYVGLLLRPISAILGHSASRPACPVSRGSDEQC